MAERTLTVLAPGPQATVQDLGRPGHAHLGVPRSGAVDLPAHLRANRIVGNPDDAATVEVLAGGLALRTSRAVTVAVTGARVPVTVDGRQREWGSALTVSAGAEVRLGQPTRGLRSYLAVAGGLDVTPVLGSRSTDLLSGLGPDPLEEGDELPVGSAVGRPVAVDTAFDTVPEPVLRIRLGPRADWFTAAAVERLTGSAYSVGSESNRIGVRLEGAELQRSRPGELPSEGMALGSVQVPPNGQPVVFLNDHPTTGGYPVVGVVLPEDLPVCAQLRPGDEVRFRVV